MTRHGKPSVDDRADRLDLVTTHGRRARLDLIDARRGERARDRELVRAR